MSDASRNERDDRPNVLVLCMDQWDTRMELPDGVRLPALERLEERGVTLDRAYCTTPICSPSRASIWSGAHAKDAGLPDNTNFAWAGELRDDRPTIGHAMRDQGYDTAFKGKWHVSDVPRGEDALERYGFADYQQWGDMFGSPLQGEQLDGTVAFHTIDWLERNGRTLDRPWFLVSSIVNPHDIMFLRTEGHVPPHPNGAMEGLLTPSQRLAWFEQEWGVELPANFEDDLALQPLGVHSYKDVIEKNYGAPPDDREDLWRQRREYLINCMRLADAQFETILDTLDRLDLWEDTAVFLISDHGEMNGAHRMHQKGAIHYDEAALVNFTACLPDGPRGGRSGAVGSLLDLAPTLLDLAGVPEEAARERYPHMRGRSLLPALRDPATPGPRGSAEEPGDGALLCWDGLHMLDPEWGVSGALHELTHMGEGPSPNRRILTRNMREVGERFGAPDLRRRCFYRAVVDGRHKLVRWFSPEEYGNPATIDELYATSDVTLHDLIADPGELQNLGHPDHPDHDPDLVERLLAKLHALVERELGEDRPPFDLDMFGTREVKAAGARSGSRTES